MEWYYKCNWNVINYDPITNHLDPQYIFVSK